VEGSAPGMVQARVRVMDNAWSHGLQFFLPFLLSLLTLVCEVVKQLIHLLPGWQLGTLWEVIPMVSAISCSKYDDYTLPGSVKPNGRLKAMLSHLVD
jgi:hypothetical protein